MQKFVFGSNKAFPVCIYDHGFPHTYLHLILQRKPTMYDIIQSETMKMNNYIEKTSLLHIVSL